MNSLAATTFAKATVVKKNAKSVKPWPMVRLGDVCEINYGTRVRKRDSKGDAYPVYGGGGETFRWDSYNRIDKCVVSRFAMSAECVRFVNGPFFLNDSGLTVESKLNQLTQVYLDWFLFGNQDLIYSIGKGSAQKNLDMKEFADLQIPLPPLSVQKEIVERLEKELGETDKIAAEFKRMVELADKEFKAELDETFGGLGNGEGEVSTNLHKSTQKLVEISEDLWRTEKGLGASSQELVLGVESQKLGADFFNAEKQSCREAEAESGDVLTQRHRGTESWPMVRLGDVCEVITGSTPSKQHKEYYGGEYPFYKPGDLDQGLNVVQSADTLTDKGWKVARKLPVNTVLVTCIGSLGKSGIIRKEGACNQQINALVVKKAIPEFIYYCVLSSSFLFNLQQMSNATTLAIVNKSQFQNLQIPLPLIEVQKEIVAKLDAAKERCEKLKAEAERGLRAAENLRKAILSVAFE